MLPELWTVVVEVEVAEIMDHAAVLCNDDFPVEQHVTVGRAFESWSLGPEVQILSLPDLRRYISEAKVERLTSFTHYEIRLFTAIAPQSVRSIQYNSTHAL